MKKIILIIIFYFNIIPCLEKGTVYITISTQVQAQTTCNPPSNTNGPVYGNGTSSLAEVINGIGTWIANGASWIANGFSLKLVPSNSAGEGVGPSENTRNTTDDTSPYVAPADSNDKILTDVSTLDIDDLTTLNNAYSSAANNSGPDYNTVPVFTTTGGGSSGGGSSGGGSSVPIDGDAINLYPGDCDAIQVDPNAILNLMNKKPITSNISNYYFTLDYMKNPDYSRTLRLITYYKWGNTLVPNAPIYLGEWDTYAVLTGVIKLVNDAKPDFYKPNGDPINYLGGVVQNYKGNDGTVYAIFTETNGNKTTFPGAIITNTWVSGGNGYTLPDGAIHATSTTFDLANLEHEYGHYLQALIFGVEIWGKVAAASLLSITNDPTNHKYSWPEMGANALSNLFFGPNSAIAKDHVIYPLTH